MTRFLFCFATLFALSACADSGFHDEYATVSTVQEDDIGMAMLTVATANSGYEMTPLYQPAVSSPGIRRSTLENLAQNSW